MVKNMPAMQETQVKSLDWEDPWRREWQPTPVFLPGESHGQRSLAGYSPWGRRESDRTEQLTLSLSLLETKTAFIWSQNFKMSRKIDIPDCLGRLYELFDL